LTEEEVETQIKAFRDGKPLSVIGKFIEDEVLK